MIARGALLVVVLACGGSTPGASRGTAASACAPIAWSCLALRPSGGDPWGCQEGDASQQSAMQATCVAAKDGLFVDGACPRDHVVAGCRIAHGAACVTTWFFQGGPTRAEIDSDCARQGGTVVAP